MKWLLYIVLLILLAFSINSRASVNPHSLHLELFGKSVFVASLSYEYDIKPNFTVGTGWGFMQISSGKYYTHNETRQGRYFDLVLSNQNYAMHRFFYQNKHRLITQYGITIQRRLEFVHFSDGGIQYADRPYLVPFLSAGYEFKGDNIIFRIPVYIAWIGISDWLFPVMPWLGLSIGIPLKKFNE